MDELCVQMMLDERNAADDDDGDDGRDIEARLLSLSSSPGDHSNRSIRDFLSLVRFFVIFLSTENQARRDNDGLTFSSKKDLMTCETKEERDDRHKEMM